MTSENCDVVDSSCHLTQSGNFLVDDSVTNLATSAVSSNRSSLEVGRKSNGDGSDEIDDFSTASTHSPLPAGVVSERCLKTLEALKNATYHSKSSNTPKNILGSAKGSEDGATEPENSAVCYLTPSRTSSPHDSYTRNKSFHTSPYKCNNLYSNNGTLLQQIRFKNQRHSDIFGIHERSNNEDNKHDNVDTSSFKSRRKIQKTTKTSPNNRLETKYNPSTMLPWQFVSLGLKGISNDAVEDKIHAIARDCNVCTVSVQIDRNIINHQCTGTGKFSFRHKSGKPGLERLLSLLSEHGIKSNIINIIEA